MAKLVIQNQGMTGRACELHTDRTTIGRVEDNTFQIADPSVSSHHCEAHLRGSDVLIRDLNSTNGSYINGNKIEESVLKPGQVLRLGQVELKLEVEGAAPTAPAPGSTPAPMKKPVDATIIFDGCPSRNRSLFPVAFTGRCGREFQTAFCVPDTSLPVCLRAEFPFGGRIDGQNKKSLCNKMKQSLLKAS